MMNNTPALFTPDFFMNPANLKPAVKFMKKKIQTSKPAVQDCKSFSDLLTQFKHKPATLLQIGACDLISFDNLYQHIKENQQYWTGIFVEPVPALFNELTENLAFMKNKTLVNKAITEQNQQYDIYIPEGKPAWLKGCPSLKITDAISKFDYKTQPIAGITFDKMIKDYTPALRNIDILQIDTEGWDFIIIQQIIPMFKPAIIKIEQRHLKPADKTKLKQFLTQHNYEFKRIGVDYICQHK